MRLCQMAAVGIAVEGNGSVPSWGPQEFKVVNTQGTGDFVNRHDCRVPFPLFQAADVLLAEAGNLRELLLGQALSQPDAPNIPPHQLAHVHALKSAVYTL